MKRYKIGVSPAGLIVYALQLLPNLLWLAAPPANDALARNSSPVPLWNILEGIFGAATVALLILLVPRDGGRRSRLFLWAAAAFLLGYYAAWALYYGGNVSPALLILGLAAMPPLYFLSAALRLKNDAAALPCAVFGAIHIAITCSTYL